MKKDSIFLADSSYTIRRIVELSFAEEENINLVSFENGLNFKDKLLEIKPKIVLIDIKLPELNGYEACKFINETEDLKDTQVFLMKGGFEPTDDNLLKDLKYIDIITKPFDSNALVNTLKELLEKKEAKPTLPDELPESMPEDVPGIDGIGDSEEEISFSDVKSEMDSDKSPNIDIGDSDEAPPREDVMPSEEKTQGSPPEKDPLKFDNIEEIENPFKDEQSIDEESEDSLDQVELEVKKNIKEQEDELEIASLTQEEINIKKIMEGKKGGIDPEPIGLDAADDEPEAKTDDQVEDTLKDLSIEEPELTDIEETPEVEETPEQKDAEPEVQLELETEEPEPLEEAPRAEEPPEIKLEPSEPERPAAEQIQKDQISGLEKEKIMTKVEDTLTVAVKEILWEIVPPLAEQIIKDEIQKIKSELDSSSD